MKTQNSPRRVAANEGPFFPQSPGQLYTIEELNSARSWTEFSRDAQRRECQLRLCHAHEQLRSRTDTTILSLKRVPGMKQTAALGECSRASYMYDERQ